MNLRSVRLPDFIRAEMGPILQNWEEFASTLLNAEHLDETGLRDHVREVLLEIADDLDAPLSETERVAKSNAHGPKTDWPPSPAVAHGGERHDTGFSIFEVISEFRALRASVQSHWMNAQPELSDELLEDLTRFHEAIDQAVAESMAEYSRLNEKDTRLFGAVLAASADPIFVLDDKGRFCFANKATTEQFNLDLDTMRGRSIFDLGCEFTSDFKRNLEKVIAGQSTYRGKFFHTHASGQDRRFEFTLAPVRDEQQQLEATVCVSRDITQQTIAERKVWHSAHHDDLTGLPNRRLFMDRLEQEVKHAKRNDLSLSVLFMDLDGFKEVNDSFGHEAGDQLLRTVADRLVDCVREEDTVARLGGDEFTVILTGINEPKDAELVAQSIIDAVVMPFGIAERSIHVSASIGISCYLEDATTPVELLKAADQAMYEAKKVESRVARAS